MISPAVSVVLPTYNRAPVLARAIRSVLAQTYSSLELIIIDDGSTDDSEHIVKAFQDSRVRYIKREHGGGVGNARNAGIRASRAPLIAFQDSDDEWLIDKLARQMQTLEKQGENAGLVCGGYIVLPVTGRPHRVRPTARMQTGDWTADNIFDFNYIAPTWLARRETLEQAGLFDETLPNLEDWEFAFRLFQHCSIHVLDAPVLIKHGSADGLNAIKSSRIASLQQIIQQHGSIWREQPQVLAKLYNELGRCQCLHRQMQQGRGNLFRALTLQRQSAKLWLHWFVALFGHDTYNYVLTRAAR